MIIDGAKNSLSLILSGRLSNFSKKHFWFFKVASWITAHLVLLSKPPSSYLDHLELILPQ